MGTSPKIYVRISVSYVEFSLALLSEVIGESSCKSGATLPTKEEKKRENCVESKGPSSHSVTS